MGASPNHQLSPRAAVALAWLNTPEKEVGRELRHLHLHLEFPHELRRLHRELRSVLLSPPVFLARPQARLWSKLVKRDRGKTPVRRLTPDDLSDLVAYMQRRLPPLPHRFITTEEDASLQLEPQYGDLDPMGQVLYAVGDLLKDLSAKGAHRLKRCQWDGCDRFFWDPTNAVTKIFCGHDAARARLRAKQSR